MDFIFPIVFLFVVYRMIAGAIKKETGKNIDWGNVGANIKNAQNALRDMSDNNGAFGQTTSVSSREDIYQPQKGTLKHLRSVQEKLEERTTTHSPWTSQSNNTPSHKRDHIHSGSNYDRDKYDAADMFENNSVHANKVLKNCDPAVSKGWRDKGDRGQTVER